MASTDTQLPASKKQKMSDSSENPDHLLSKIGGPAALEAAVDIFYEKLVADETLEDFFEGVDMSKLKAHQRKFLTLALTEIPKDVDVPKMMSDSHGRLFKMGLNAKHFDSVAGHLVQTLKGLQVKASLIDEIVAVVAPLRVVFEENSKDFLLTKIGGPQALSAAVDIFYEKLVADEKLAKFFEGIKLDNLKAHQRKFLTLALTKVPEGVDVPALMDTKHAKLFKMGLNESHFDLVAGHLVATLEGLQVKKEHIDAIVGIVGPLRVVFEEGAKKYAAEDKSEQKDDYLLTKIGGPSALEAAVDIFYEKLVVDPQLAKFFEGIKLDNLKAHQRKFLTLALTKVPEGVDVPALMDTKHAKLFKMGLNESHFDLVAGHLVATLEGLQVKKEHIDAIVGIVGPLRVVFEEGAKKYAADK
eukprot:CAMPEP_0202473912 /NCGR_PEP_ID=MMETSP1360-20130828/92100_1 /ASSEMBLY_ACC=CAM_ASM_000848 /TAXON_ID=515479 /ORGANISM="Licmophora paradoxa, Strain CCMP2313" /LENGTH=413 /DNA_ID=CAMNT_0049100997 /DNA_START=106 /DNA_END=1347 /DNA_ORIENTATION=-